MSDAYVVQWSEQSTDNRKTWARPQRSRKRLFSTERFSNSLNILIHLHYLRYKSLKLSTSIPVRTNVRQTLKVQNAPAENMDSIVAKFARIAFRIARI